VSDEGIEFDSVTDQVEEIEDAAEMVSSEITDETLEEIESDGVDEQVSGPVDEEGDQEEEGPDWLKAAAVGTAGVVGAVVVDKLTGDGAEGEIQPEEIHDEEAVDWLPEEIEDQDKIDDDVSEIFDKVVPEDSDETLGGSLFDQKIETPEDSVSDFVTIPEPDLDDPDAAMAWLESLAAKQGVSEDELLTSPEERSEEPPEWIQEAVESDQVDDDGGGIHLDEDSDVLEGLDQISDDELPEWLNKIPEDLKSQDDSIVDGPEEIPEWLLDISEDVPSIAGEEEVTSEGTIDDGIEGIPSWIQEISEEELPEVDVSGLEEDIIAESIDEPEETLTWLDDLPSRPKPLEEELVSGEEKTADDTPVGDFEEAVQEHDLTVEELVDDPDVEPLDVSQEELSDLLEADIPIDSITIDEDQQIIDEIRVEPVKAIEAPSDEPETKVGLGPEEKTVDDIIAEADESAVSEFGDVDAAMAWLESLAAKQGVSDDELLTAPEARSETPPDWILEITDAIDTEDDAEDAGVWIDEVFDADEDGIHEEEVEVETKFGQPEEAESQQDAIPLDETRIEDVDFDNVDAAMAWLESLAAKQGVSEDELLTRPEERSETPPDWVHQELETGDTISMPEETTFEDPARLDDISQQADEAGSEISEVEEELPLAPPAWVTDGQVPEDEDLTWLPTEDSDDESLLLDLNQASLIQLERLPGIGFRRAQSITAYREEHGDFNSMDMLLDVPGMDSDTLELLKTRVTVITAEQDDIVEPVLDSTLFPPIESETDENVSEIQLSAREKMNDGNISNALEDYAELITEGQNLSFVIEDLKLAVEKYPEDVSVLQALGDAYMQANMLEEALDAYSQAGKLLH